MPRMHDLSGMRFGRLKVIRESDKSIHKKNTHIKWLCLCDCGNYVDVASNSLKNGATQSCGCYHSKRVIESHTKHGLCYSRLHSIHTGIKQRCYNPNAPRYDRYGERNITVCDEWLGENGFITFYKWAMANGYSDNLTIDRIDNDKGYSPDNCRWVTVAVQNNNKSTSHFITVNGVTHTIAEWAEINGIDKRTIVNRIRLGWNEEDAVTVKTFGRRSLKAKSGYRNIKINPRKDGSLVYLVYFTKNHKHYNKTFGSLEEAIKYRDENVEVIPY